MKRSSVDSAWARSPVFQYDVGQVELRLLRQQRAGGAAFDALERLDRALVAAAAMSSLASAYNLFGRCWRSVVLRRRAAAGSSSGQRTASRRSAAARIIIACDGRRRRFYRSEPISVDDDLARRDAERRRPERRVDDASAWSTRLARQRLDKALVALAGEFSRSHLQGLIERGHVRVDGARRRRPRRASVRAGQRVDVDLVPTAESRAFSAEPMALDGACTRTSTCW